MKPGELAALRRLERWVRQNKGIPREAQATERLRLLLADLDRIRRAALEAKP